MVISDEIEGDGGYARAAGAAAATGMSKDALLALGTMLSYGDLSANVGVTVSYIHAYTQTSTLILYPNICFNFYTFDELIGNECAL